MTETKITSKNEQLISVDNVVQMAHEDLVKGIRSRDLWWTFACFDIKQRFRRSVLGPLWLTLAMGIFIGALGFVMSQLFKQTLGSFLPYLSVGIIFWTLLTSIITEGCTAFIASTGFIRNVPMPLSVHYYRMFARNQIIWAYNMVIYFAIFFIFVRKLSYEMLLFIPGMILFSINAFLIGLTAAIICTRFRDVPPIIASLLQVIFFVTPIFWSVQSLPDRITFILFNPFYHLLEIVRAPLLGQAPELISWLVSIGLIFVFIPVTLYLYRRAYARISYWV